MEETKVAQKGDLLSFRPDIKVLDATIRDGGLVNDFYFTDEFIRNLYLANVKAGVDYMEFGYRADKEMFDVNKFGNLLKMRQSGKSLVIIIQTLRFPLWQMSEDATINRIYMTEQTAQ